MYMTDEQTARQKP